MSMIDYGALLRINGEFVNKNGDLFADMKDMCGFELEEAVEKSNGETRTVQINNNFYVYAGTPEFFLCFYKTYFLVVSNGVVIANYFGSQINSETIYTPFTNIKISHLDKEYRNHYYNRFDDFDKEYLKSRYGKNKAALKILRNIKHSQHIAYRYKSSRYLSEWEFGGNKYEVMFGYGIDPDQDVWERINADDAYSFSQVEIDQINSWFK